MTLDEQLDRLVARWSTGKVVPREAQKLVTRLRSRNPEILVEWLDVRAETLIAVEIQRRLAGSRARLRRDAGPRAFENWRQQVEENRGLLAEDEAPLESAFMIPYCVDGVGTWKRLADMTREDCLFVAHDRRARVREQLLEAAFLEAVAKRLRDGETVRDRFSPDELDELNGNQRAA